MLAAAERRFADWLAQLPDLAELPARQASRVLDLGCGGAACAYAVTERWPDAQIIGVDHDVSKLAAAPSFVWALYADVRALPFNQPVFNVIIIRHPDVFRRPDSWQKAINAAGRLLQVNGCLLVTCYSLPEAEQIAAWLRDGLLQMGQAIPFRRDIMAPPDLVDHDRFAFAWQFTAPL